MTDLEAGVVSITRTARGRYFWAAWWTGEPVYAPIFRKPDACNGGARSADEALAEAERVSGRRLGRTTPDWARAANRLLRGEKPSPPPAAKPARRVDAPQRARSAWEILGLRPGASFEAIKRAHRERALATHPDHGGDPEAFRQVQRAFERLKARHGP